MVIKDVIKFCCSAVIFVACSTANAQQSASLQANETNDITPSDVLAKVQMVREEINLIRLAMGQPAEKQTLVTVSNAKPREVYFQAEALFQKSNRLAHEVAGSLITSPTTSTKNLLPGNVLQMVNAALTQLLAVKKKLHITQTVQQITVPEQSTPSEVFNELLDLNQQLNGLLYQRFFPSDVFEQVTIAINYTEKLLKAFDVDKRVPLEPAYVPNRTPADVYQRLIACIVLLQSIAKNSGVSMLKVQVDLNSNTKITSSNVYDLSKIIVAEVRYLNTILSGGGNERNIGYYPGYKIPSDVYQRAGVLLEQLEVLASYVKKNLDWLKLQEKEVRR